MKKQNCWEFKNCGNKDCEAREDETLQGIHGGSNGGRACWTVAGTLCIPRTLVRNHQGGDFGLVRGKRLEVREEKKTFGVFAKELGNCRRCEFYQTVQEEEGLAFIPALAIHAIYEERRNGDSKEA